MRHILRVGGALALVALVTAVDFRLLHLNSSTAGFTYLLLILFLATRSGLPAAIAASFASMLCYDFFFLPPIGKFSIGWSRRTGWLCSYS